MRIVLLGLFIVGSILSSCRSHDEDACLGGLEDWQVERVCRLYVQKEFEDLVEEYYSCRFWSEEERARMVMMLEQHAGMRERKELFPVSVRYVRAELYPGDSVADVFVEMVYADGKTENGVFQMLRDGEDWYIR